MHAQVVFLLILRHTLRLSCCATSCTDDSLKVILSQAAAPVPYSLEGCIPMPMQSALLKPLSLTESSAISLLHKTWPHQSKTPHCHRVQ